MNGFLISSAIKQVNKEFGDAPTIQKLHCFTQKESWSPQDRQTILNLITQSLTTRELTEAIAERFSPILLDLFSRIAQTSSQLTLFCVLSSLIGHYACATNFAYEKFGSGFFDAESLFIQAKNEKLQTIFIESCYVFLNYDSAFFQSALDWSFISKLIAQNSSSKSFFKWIIVKIYEILLQIDCSNNELSKFDENESAKFQLRCFNLAKTRALKLSSKSIHYGFIEHSNGAILDCDFSSNVVSVYGILLQRFKPLSSTASDVIVLPSVETNLQTAALGVSIGKPILVEGPMGSGKTTLIRQLARLTGREQPPEVLTVQISDQVDSKYLLGSYICSDVPGEFLFNLGPLLRAIQSGSWLVLEDIDFASSDVISLVTSIIESKTASSIPGCENKIDKFNSNFRIFFTRRVSGATSSEVNNYNLVNLLGRACTVVSINNLDFAETSQLIEQKWPSLKPIIPKIIEIYQNLTTSDKISVKRYITLRDLIKWCHRLANYFQLNSANVAEDAFLDAIDCFASFSSNAELFQSKSLTLSSSLNITKAVCEQLLTRRTPNIDIGQDVVIGRQKIERHSSTASVANFAYTTQSLQLLERLAVCVHNGEAVLLCGETGVGKTSCIQYLASLSGKHLTVINMNQQSDSVELFGGYKPIDIKFLVNNARDEYQSLFAATFNSDKNATFMAKFIRIYNKRDWKSLVQIMKTVCDQGLRKTAQNKEEELQHRWTALKTVLRQIEDHLNNKSELTFAFMEGALTKAVKKGHWVLLDEINLAEYETLQSLLTMLDKDASFLLFEKASDQAVQVHKDFRLFACMNPATDIGKRELPIGIQNRFTEFYISEISDKAELRKLVGTYIGSLVGATMVEAIVDFYMQVKVEAANALKDINGYRPIYSLRNLCRALRIASSNPFHAINRSIYESFCLAFLSNLDTDSAVRVQKLIGETMFGKKLAGMLRHEIDLPNADKYVKLEDCAYPVVKGPRTSIIDETYIRTLTVQKNLHDISRIVFAGKTLPILLQGETSVGKTSLITWLANATGNVCIRVNNHEHTDLQEYVGSYSSDESGKIVFKEGVLVEAMRKGYWLILDELNLAPTEVLEALNRVLDDNRELFIPETQEVIKAHPGFLLFATQNPPGRYGGRKVLSRAFRNRFIELHFSEIPSEELITILHLKCLLPKSYAKRMVEVLLELQRCRSKSDIFAGKHGLITLRDLFRWGNRYMKFSQNSTDNFFDWDKFLAEQGFMLLAGRCRKTEEMTLIREIIQKKFRCILDLEKLFYAEGQFESLPQFGGVVWTKAFRRLGTLIREAIKYGEPVLLVGETGCGKTTICQYFAALESTTLRIVNCHMNTESADFLGSLRPNRNLGAADTTDSGTAKSEALFEWVDGPLIRSMKEGSYLLVDEISLADDSVLERLNSVLEFERTLFLAESSEAPLIKAADAFRYFATMNPGGDYGKKELSPALRDRFTEIWCPVYEDEEDIRQIIEHNIALASPSEKSAVSSGICQFISWFQSAVLNLKQPTYSIRDILTWVNFINQCSTAGEKSEQLSNVLSLREAFTHGAFLVLVDSLGTCNTNTRNFQSSLQSARQICEEKLLEITSKLPADDDQLPKSVAAVSDSSKFTVAPFSTDKGQHQQQSTEAAGQSNYFWQSSGVQMNLFRIMRALQLDKPILLEGPPGVGKTSLVQALAAVTGHALIRINLSEQTDIADLFGCDLPVEGENSAGRFSFRDGPLLKALKASHSTWILLDELNLASQTVLEGLNACLDHRGEIYIPELNRTFHIDKAQSRIFASQNPFSMDGSRKGLPKSFLNRFTVVYVDHLGDEDFNFILANLYASLGTELISRMIRTNRRICTKVLEDGRFARKGGPFEFNLRDLLRWAEVTSRSAQLFGAHSPELFFDLIFTNKMRTKADREKIESICAEEFAYRKDPRQIAYYVQESGIQFGHSICQRVPGFRDQQHLGFLFQSHKQVIESVLKCIEMNWMAILIGAAGSGKTFIVQMLANLCGQRLHIFNVNSEMDTNDLLGGFEQKDFAVDLKEVEDSVLAVAYRLVKQNHQNFELLSQFLCFRSQLKRSNLRVNIDDFSSFKVQLLKSILVLFDTSANDEEVLKLDAKLKYLERIAANRQLLNGAFEWKDSQLIKCIEAGHWLLIDNANQLNASVLDRLNSLLEGNEGALVINEKGSVDGELVSVRAHANFRLFLTTNTQHGELSRAMRNRGIEIVLPELVDDQLEALYRQLGSLCGDAGSSLPADADYSTTFRSIYETILKSQHGFHTAVEIDGGTAADLQPPKAPLPLCINSLLADPSTFYVLQDFMALSLAERDQTSDFSEGTRMRLFLESASPHDISLRREVLASMLPAEQLGRIEMLHLDTLEDVKHYLRELFGQHYGSVRRLPIDLRENAPLHQLTCRNAAFSADQMQQLNTQLNVFHLSLYQSDLVQRLKYAPESSMMALAVKIVGGQLKAKLFPQSIVPIYHAMIEMRSSAAGQLMDGQQLTDSSVPLIRSQLLWIFRLAQSCYAENQSAVDWNLFIQERFFPLWFMFNEQIVPRLNAKDSSNNNQLAQLISSVNALFKLNDTTFNAVKFELLKQMTANYFQFNTANDIDLFGQVTELWKLMTSSSSNQKASVAELNSISQQCVSLLAAYYGGSAAYDDTSKQIVEFCNQLHPFNNPSDEDSKVSKTEERTLVKSDLLMSSIIYSKLFNYFAADQQSDVNSLLDGNSIAIDPLLLFASRTLQQNSSTNQYFLDIVLYLLVNMNEHFSVTSVIDYFIGKSSHSEQKPQNSFFSASLVSKSASLTVEALPLLSLTCFNIYQIDQISAEEFFCKSFTLDFYMNFLVRNYATFKSTHSLFVDKYIDIAKSMQQQLHSLDSSPAVTYKLKLTNNNSDDDEAVDGAPELSSEVDKYFYLISVGFQIAARTSVDFPIDPIVRSHAILEHCQAETAFLEEEISLRLKLKQCKFGTDADHFDSAVMVSLENRLTENQATLASTTLPSRLSTSKYFHLKSDMDQFCGTIFKWSHLQPLCANLLQCLANGERTPKADIDRAIRASVNCQHSLAKFVKHIESSYRNYSDLSSPFLLGVSLVLKGLQLATFALQSRTNTGECFASFEPSAMATLSGTFFQFLNTHCPHEIGEFILANDCINKFAGIASKLAIEEKSLIVSLLKSAFLEIENSIYLGYDRRYLLTLYLDIVNLFVQWWSHAKQQEEMEKIKSESTFHMKLADEPDDANLREVFPSFEERFRDLIDDDKNFRDLSKNTPLVNDDVNAAAVKENIELSLSKETLLFIVRSHMKLITLNHAADVCEAEAIPDMFQPYLIRYQILSDIFKKTLGFVDLNIEKGLIDGHILVNQHLRNLKGADELEDRPINVYRESLVSQTRQCFNILDKLKRKVVTELLPQFENHPTLLKLLKVIDRVYKIEVNASLLSFATGLEVILKTGEDWQLIAHRGISLIEHLNEITGLLVEWRKLEIKYWGYCLQSVIERTEEHELLTWWFHFYMALQDLADRQADEQALTEFVGSVMRFIEKSSFGQFEVRLRILQCFVHQLRQSDTTASRGLLLTSLENLHRFYGHFADHVRKAIEAERAPIEKEIKEFVKISKWNPNNFWSLKASLDKSHSQLYGYMKKFELAMNKPASSVFIFEKALKTNTWKMCFDFVYKSNCSHNSEVLSTLDSAEGGDSVLSQHHSYIRRSDGLCRKIIRMCRTPLKAINQLEEVNNELISGINEYASLKVVAPSDDLLKWKKAVGLIQNRKRRALSDLFTQLTKFGLSFRKGLVQSNELNVSLMISSIYPLTGEEHLADGPASANVLACNTYFYKCLSGLMKFVSGCRSEVNPQITPDMRDRMEGFTTELARIVAGRRTTASTEMDRFTRLNGYLKAIDDKCCSGSGGCEAVSRLMNAAEMRSAFDDAQQLLTKFISFSIRLRAVLQGLQSTSSSSNSSSLNTPIIAEASDFSTLNTFQLDSLIADLRAMYSLFEDSSKVVFYTVVDLRTLQSVAGMLRQSFDCIKKMLQEGGSLLGIYGEHLSVFEVRFAALDGQLQQWSQLVAVNDGGDAENSSSSNNNTKQCCTIIKKIRLSVQKTYFSLLEKQQKSAEKKEEEEADDKELVRQSLVFELLSQLNAAKIDHLIVQFFERINADSSEQAAVNYQLVCALQPFLHQYMTLYRSALSLVFGSLKCTSKMLHIILSLFNELLANGFCLPPEPNEKKENSQLKDIQNSGFGSGDTSEAKDVSDRLDCQDQLDELAKNEDEEDDANDDSEKDDKNDDKGVEMDEDFEGKETGGEQEEEEKDGKEEEEEDNEDQFDEKMGNVDDEEEMLDEKLWGDESEEEDNAEDLNESEQTGGKDNIESEIVANENNQDLKKNDEENAESEDDEAKQQDSEEINENEMNDEYQGEAPDKYKDNGADEKPDDNPDQKMELPEDINLDDVEEDGEDSEGDQDNEKMDTDEAKEEEPDDENKDDGVPQMEDAEMLNEEGEEEDQLKDDQEENIHFDVNTEDKESEAQLDESKPNLKYNDSNVANFDQQQQNSANATEQNEPVDEEQTQKTVNTEPSSGRKNQDKISQSTSAQNAPENEQNAEEMEDQSISKNNKNMRSLAEDVHKAKRQKIMHCRENDSLQKEQQQSDTYRHVEDAEKANEVAYDMAMPEEFDQKEQQMDDAERGVQFADEPEMETAEEELTEQQQQQQQPNKKETGAADAGEDQQLESVLAIQGELVPTMVVTRPDESTFHQTDPMNLLSEEVNSMELEHREPLEANQSAADLSCSSDSSWRECEQKIEPLVYELCNQLQLVLEPTKCAKFKGDYKSGKRLNMRKVIAYVASDFRKDKIWLRRSKPSKRQYQILIAVDDSLSMDDNHSKQMAAESLILLGKSLSIIESGALSVLSFGEVVRVLHSFSEPFTDQSAFKMFSKFTFCQQQTQITEMLQCSLSLFSKARQSSSAGRVANSSNVYQLLLIVSDGRGINSEGNEHLQRAILKLKEMNIFTVFLIIDNPEHKQSILDIQRAVFRTDDSGKTKGKVVLSSYIEQFPFPYYVILKDINSLPSILGEALRQWFEMITYEVQ